MRRARALLRRPVCRAVPRPAPAPARRPPTTPLQRTRAPTRSSGTERKVSAVPYPGASTVTVGGNSGRWSGAPSLAASRIVIQAGVSPDPFQGVNPTVTGARGARCPGTGSRGRRWWTGARPARPAGSASIRSGTPPASRAQRRAAASYSPPRSLRHRRPPSRLAKQLYIPCQQPNSSQTFIITLLQ